MEPFITRVEFVKTRNNNAQFMGVVYTRWVDYVKAYAAHYSLLAIHTAETIAPMSSNTYQSFCKKYSINATMRKSMQETKVLRCIRFFNGDFDYPDDRVITHGVGKCFTCGARATFGDHRSVSIHNPYGVGSACAEHADRTTFICTDTDTCRHVENNIKCGVKAFVVNPETGRAEYCAKHAGHIPRANRRTRAPTCCGVNGSVCATVPSMGPSGSKTRVSCGPCNELGKFGYECVTGDSCIHADHIGKKNVSAKFNYPGQTKGEYCKKHIKPGMVNVMSKKCTVTGCNTYPVFGYKGKPATHCGPHRLPDMENRTAKKCEECNKQPAFNYPPAKKGIRCVKHKLPGMENVISPRCTTEGCRTQPTHAAPGEFKPVKCGAHATATMGNIRMNKCIELICNTTASFNLPERSPPIYCAEHRHPGMINIKDKMCTVCCTAYAKWGITSRTHCGLCATAEMTLQSGRRCVSCGRRDPTYNIEGLKPQYCVDCKTPEMTNMKNVRCPCGKLAKCGPLYATAVRCVSCKQPGDYKKRQPICCAENCDKLAELAIVGYNYPTSCEDHMAANVQYANLRESNCQKCGSRGLLNAVTQLCDTCLGVVKNIEHAKEKRIGDVLAANEIPISYRDIVIDRTCNLKRPDYVIIHNHIAIIVEVDENQHFSYPRECEQERMVGIQNALGMEHVVFLRYNPDNYVTSTGDRQLGKPENITREIKLVEIIKTLMNSEPNNGLYVCYLYYDGFDGAPKFARLDERGRPM